MADGAGQRIGGVGFEGTPTAFSAMPGGHDPEKLFAEIGRLKMENDLLKKTLR